MRWCALWRFIATPCHEDGTPQTEDHGLGSSEMAQKVWYETMDQHQMWSRATQSIAALWRIRSGFYAHARPCRPNTGVIEDWDEAEAEEMGITLDAGKDEWSVIY